MYAVAYATPTYMGVFYTCNVLFDISSLSLEVFW